MNSKDEIECNLSNIRPLYIIGFLIILSSMLDLNTTFPQFEKIQHLKGVSSFDTMVESIQINADQNNIHVNIKINTIFLSTSNIFPKILQISIEAPNNTFTFPKSTWFDFKLNSDGMSFYICSPVGGEVNFVARVNNKEILRKALKLKIAFVLPHRTRCTVSNSHLDISEICMQKNHLLTFAYSNWENNNTPKVSHSNIRSSNSQDFQKSQKGSFHKNALLLMPLSNTNILDLIHYGFLNVLSMYNLYPTIAFSYSVNSPFANLMDMIPKINSTSSCVCYESARMITSYNDNYKLIDQVFYQTQYNKKYIILIKSIWSSHITNLYEYLQKEYPKKEIIEISMHQANKAYYQYIIQSDAFVFFNFGDDLCPIIILPPECKIIHIQVDKNEKEPDWLTEVIEKRKLKYETLLTRDEDSKKMIIV